MLTLPGKPLTRRQFFGRMKRLGFKKSRLQMTRIGLTYDKEDESIAMRVKKKRTKKELVASRDESYGKWGKRSKDWKKA